MAGLIIFPVANSSLGIPAAGHILSNFPEHTVLFTVRDASDSDANTQKLHEVIAKYPQAKSIIHEVDLSSLSLFMGFPISDPEITADGYDKAFEVAHISHVALILRLLGQFHPAGHIVLLSRDCHWPGKNMGETYPPSIPSDLNLLVKPSVDDDNQARGYQRYATAKLAMTTWIYALNRYLGKDENLKNITVLAMNPGNLVDLRALRVNTPSSMAWKQKYLYKPLPLFQLISGPTLRTAKPAGIDVADIALSRKFAGERGFFTLLEKDESSLENRDEKKQELLWIETLKWAKISVYNTALQTGFP